MRDASVLDLLIPESNSFYIMDRGHLDFQGLYNLHLGSAFFVTPAKFNSEGFISIP
jgi:hypothetical protein